MTDATPDTPESTLTVDVDVTNPGQFLACCGLLELASRLDDEAVGWFEGKRFHLHGDIADPLQHLLGADVKPISDDGDDNAPSPSILLGQPFLLRIDWWEDETATRSGFKTWSGGQTVMGFVDGMRDQLRQRKLDLHEVLSSVYTIKKPKPFYFDSRLSRLTAIDMGRIQFRSATPG